jgi:hypothetical protein
LICFLQNNRTRESSVVISPQWSMLEEIEFHRLAKLRLEVDDPVDLWVILSFLLPRQLTRLKRFVRATFRIRQII